MISFGFWTLEIFGFLKFLKPMFWVIHLPHYKGSLVMKPALFDHCATSFSLINNRTKIGQCAVCNGLLFLPDHVVFRSFSGPIM